MRDYLSELSDKFDALADKTRLNIFIIIVKESLFCDLNEEPVYSNNSVLRIAKITKLAQSTVSHHITKLKKAGLIYIKQKEKFQFLFPNIIVLKQLRDALKLSNNSRQNNILFELKINKLDEKSVSEISDYISLNDFKLSKPIRIKKFIRFYFKNSFIYFDADIENQIIKAFSVIKPDEKIINTGEQIKYLLDKFIQK